MKRILLGMATMLVAAATSFAADAPLITKAQTQTAQVYTWNGPYAWGYIGAGQSRNSATLDDPISSTVPKNSHPYANCAWQPYYCMTVNSAVPTGVDGNMSGLLIGGGIGYDWQLYARLVAGLEFDMAYATLHGSAVTGNVNVSRDMTYIGFIGGRIGYLIVPQALVYFKGGAAFANFETTSNLGTASDVKWGWTIGGGLEWQLAQVAQGLAIRGEAMYARFPDQTITGPGGTIGSAGDSVTTIKVGAVKRF